LLQKLLALPYALLRVEQDNILLYNVSDMITDMDSERFKTHSLTEARIMRILSAALKAVEPAEAVRNHLPDVSGDVYGLGVGKASIPMLTALAEAIPLSDALAISKHASEPNSYPVPVILGNHPIPNTDSLRAGGRALEFVSSLKESDTLVCLISGGGSALMTVPHEGISLEDMQALTSLLLSCGARIDEINTLRRKLDRVKGGGLARATKAKVVSLILSDVIGNPLEAIASGPTVQDPTTNEDALAVLEKYFSNLTAEARRHGESIDFVTQCLRGSKQPKAHDYDYSRVQNIIIGDNKLAAAAAREQAKREGFDAEILTNELQGEAREVGVMLAKRLRGECAARKRPFCLIAGGETTVTIRGDGKGGRNQELALAAVEELRDLENVMLISLASDGEDGPTDAAGAVVTGESNGRAEKLGLDAADFLSRNDAYHFFQKLGDLLMTGPSGTNVNDLVFLLSL
jgi:glycerate 2-kinase